MSKHTVVRELALSTCGLSCITKRRAAAPYQRSFADMGSQTSWRLVTYTGLGTCRSST